MDTGWINDFSEDERDLDVLGEDVPETRGFVDLRLVEQRAHFFAASRATAVTDSEFFRDFRPDRDATQPQPSAWTEAGWQSDGWTLSVFAQSNVNEDFAAIERLPEITLSHAPMALGATGAWLMFEGRFANLRRYDTLDPSVGMPLESPFLSTDFRQELSATVAVQRPVEVTRWLTWTPQLEGRADFAEDFVDQGTSGVSGDGDTAQLSVGADLRARLFAQGNVRNETWRIDGLRHRVHLVAQYRWVPRLDNEDFDPQDARTDFFLRGTALPPLDLIARRGPFENQFGEGEPHRLRLGIENWLETRDADAPGGVRQLAALHLYQEVNLDPANAPAARDPLPEAETWSATYLALRTRPANWLELVAEGRLDTADGVLGEGRFLARVRSGAVWGFDLAADYLRGDALEQYAGEGFYWLLDNWALIGGARFDAVREDWTRQRVGVRYRLGRSWEIEATLDWREGDAREDSLGLSVRVDLVRF